MNRTTFGKKTPSTQCPRVDRFITPRQELADMSRRKTQQNTCDMYNYNILNSKHVQQQNYISYLDRALGLQPRQRPCSEYWPIWPCVPRKKKYLSSADVVLDLPSYSKAPFPELLDWSKDDVLVAALGQKYYKRNWKTHGRSTEGFTQRDVQCCKFDPKGEFLLLGTDSNMIELHSNERNKCVKYNLCCCATQADCSITAVDWSPTGNSFVTGCSQGSTIAFSRCGRQLLSWRCDEGGAIFMLRVSPDARYVAAAVLDSPIVLLLLWPSLKLYTTLNSEYTVKSIAWHPWRSALLGVGSMTSEQQVKITLCDVPSARVKEVNYGPMRFSLDTMLFSHLTGELVLSVWKPEVCLPHLRSSTALMVMSDPWTVVDRWQENWSGLDKIRTMVFSPDGTKLATATAEEDLIIWNFLPNCEYGKKTRRRFCALPFYLDQASNGVSYR